ncbi:hypothetical protein AVEN_198974-1 [Araneus ventricosus]|uniref:Uncharacterized protein n=1 Tax=Araneus ventricosus TaxID=182803 RepID=A0A4Y2VYG9_ARAVE|nr:hypothetical protein AVEN_198974-1 [Araneus ventricosus]
MFYSEDNNYAFWDTVELRLTSDSHNEHNKLFKKKDSLKVTETALTSDWKKLWPESIVECDLEGFVALHVEPVVNEIVSLAKINGTRGR